MNKLGTTCVWYLCAINECALGLIFFPLLKCRLYQEDNVQSHSVVMSLPVTPRSGWGQWKNWSFSRVKGKKRKQNYPPTLDPPESRPLCSPPTNGHPCRSITSGPAHLTSKEKSQKHWHHQHKPHTASNDQDVGLSVALSRQRQGPSLLNAIISVRSHGIHLTPRKSSSHQQFTTSNDILPDMSPTQIKLKILNQA